MYACICHAVTEKRLRESIGNGRCESLDDIAAETGAGSCCGRCEDYLAFILEDEQLRVNQNPAAPVPSAAPAAESALASSAA